MPVQLAGDSGTGTSVPEEALAGLTSEEGAPATEETSPEAQPAVHQDQAFFDATKVPAGLQASFKEMQGAWTKKVEEFAPYRNFEEKYGKLDEVTAVLDQLSDPQGVLNWWVGVAAELGVDQKKLGELFQQAGGSTVEPAAPAVPGSATSTATPAAPANPNDPNRPMTMAEFQQWQQQQAWQSQQAQVQQQEDKTVEDALAANKVTDQARPFVLTAAQRQPAHLGYAERIRRGAEEFNSFIASQAAAKTPQRQQPAAFGGSSPGAVGQSSNLKGFGDAAKAAQAYIDSLGA